MCNLFNQTTAQAAMRQLFQHLGWQDRGGNLQPGDVYPDQMAPVIRHAAEGGLELVRARWGMPTPRVHMKTERDPGVTNIRNVTSPHWRRWLAPESRCLVPLTAFAETLGRGLGNQWFAAVEPDTLMFFAGVETRSWKSLRKVKGGETVDDLFAFLTCAPNAEVAAIHPKAMPVIMTTSADWETWLTEPWVEVRRLQRPLPDGALKLIDPPVATPAIVLG